MQIKNNYRLRVQEKRREVSGKGIFNGETGVVCGQSILTTKRSGSSVMMTTRWVEYPYVQLDEIEPAYAVTVHKSQGSEFPVVIIPMSWFPPATGHQKSHIYGCYHGEREKSCIVGRRDYFNAMVDNECSREDEIPDLKNA